MFELMLLAGFGAITIRNVSVRQEESPVTRNISDKLGKLWDIAHQGMRENRFLRAEKALLTILKIDQTNAAAYNRLGILYAKQKEYKDAIDCFEIASSIDPSASSLHNLGLIYYETENYNKAAQAFEHALKLEDSMAARHIAYAKVQEKLGNIKLMLAELNTAVDIEPTYESYDLLKRAYEGQGMLSNADEVEEIMKKLKSNSASASKTKKKVKRPGKRVVV